MVPMRPTGRARAEDVAYMRDLREAMLIQKPQGSLAVLYLMAAVFVGALVWAGFARVEEITMGEARVIPASREQVIQSLDPGVVTELLVREGEVVEKGQLLLRIDDTRASALFRELQGKAWADSTPLGPVLATPDELPADAELVTRVDGVEKQRGDVHDLVHDPVHLVRYVSTMTRLEPGDVIITGTPGGVGVAREPREFLTPGRTVTV